MDRIVEFLPIALALVVLTLVFITIGKLLAKANRAEMFALAARYGASLHQVSTNQWFFDVVVHGVTVRIRRVYTAGAETRRCVQTAEIGLPLRMSRFCARVLFSNPGRPHGLDPGFAKVFTLETDDPTTFLALVPTQAQAQLRRLAGPVANGAIVSNGTAITYSPGRDLTANLDEVLQLMASIGLRANALAHGHQLSA